jgi:biotin carboxyl carrier protein
VTTRATVRAAVRVRPVQAGGDPAEVGLLVEPDQPGAWVEWLDRGHAILVEGSPADGGPAAIRTRLLIGPAHRRPVDGVMVREVVVDGWRLEVELEAEGRAALRDRARRGESSPDAGGPIEIRADLPGRISSLLVGPGDPVVAGQALVVIEAMKMLNELRAPRDGQVERTAVEVNQAVELGDLLVVLR